jgi:hypothetical protein
VRIRGTSSVTAAITALSPMATLARISRSLSRFCRSPWFGLSSAERPRSV